MPVYPLLEEPTWMNLLDSCKALINDPGDDQELLTQHARLLLLDALALYWDIPEVRQLHAIVLAHCSQWEEDMGY